MIKKLKNLIINQTDFFWKKYLYRKYIHSFNPIVVASTGRAGSTMLFNSIIESYIENQCKISLKSKSGGFLLNNCSLYLDRLEDLDNFSYAIYKTHDQWNSTFSDRAKYIFLHSDPYESAQSVEKKVNKDGLDWFIEHQKHLRAFGDFNDIYKGDVLNYRGQIKSWLDKKQKNVLCIAYEDIWSHIGEISMFVGFDVNLPEYKERSILEKYNKINLEFFSDLQKLRNSLMLNNNKS